MSDTIHTLEQAAVLRLFDLAQEGATDSNEFQRLEAMVYGRLAESYAADGAAPPATGIQTQVAQAA